MNAVTEIIHECYRAGLTLRITDGCIRVRPRSKLTPELADAIKAQKQGILDALKGSSRPSHEGQGPIMRSDPESPEPEARVRYVTCESCAHWTGDSPCGAGLHTSGDPVPGVAVRICGFHTPKGVRS